jgi:D-alanyl-D-alanine dipeptidase
MLFNITSTQYPILLDMRYATPHNFTGHPIYQNPLCFLHEDCRKPFEKAITLAHKLGLTLKIFDAFRPHAAQEALWSICPDPMYVTPPERGSPHTRGVAIDLTLTDSAGHELDMGTPFDDFTTQSHHGASSLTAEQTQNRFLLLGVMMSAGWDFYQNEWWHYQLFKAREYPLITDNHGMM